MLKSTEIAFDFDRVFSLSAEEMVKEIVSCVIAMHTMTTIRREITGIGGRSRFEWPAIGDTGSCVQLFSHLEVLQGAVDSMVSCIAFQKAAQGSRQKWTERDFVSYLVGELTEHYSSKLKSMSGRGSNRELAAFVELLKTENYDIVSDLMESKNRAETLFEELKYFRRMAKTGEKLEVRPERKFRITLADIKNSIEEKKGEKVSLPELVDLVTDAFDAIAEMVQGNMEALGTDTDRFTETLCFETSQRILELLGLQDTIGDLPWVSRFISEESFESGGTPEQSSRAPEDRIRRISSAFAGGVVYMAVQALGS